MNSRKQNEDQTSGDETEVSEKNADVLTVDFYNLNKIILKFFTQIRIKKE